MSGIFSPSQAAEQSGFSLDTLRYHERIGLLDGIDRAPSGHRRFDEDDLEWLGVLRCLRDTGMPIAQMRQHVGSELRRTGSPTVACAELRREPPREGSGHESQPTVSRADHPNLHCRLSGRSPRYSHADRRLGSVRLPWHPVTFCYRGVDVRAAAC